jgi:hypothetical protein
MNKTCNCQFDKQNLQYAIPRVQIEIVTKDGVQSLLE